MDILHFDYTLLIRLVTAIICGGVIGLERGGNNHEAGLRTHMVLCLGSALVMITSICICGHYSIPQEAMRMSAQVISGVGFLGAGSIIANGGKIKGITTAAGLWTTACVGLTVGAGYYILAIFTVLLILFIMIVLKPITERLKSNSKQHRFMIEVTSKKFMQQFLTTISKSDVEIVDLRFHNLQNGNIKAEVEVNFIKRASFVPFVTKLSEYEEVVGFKALE